MLPFEFTLMKSLKTVKTNCNINKRLRSNFDRFHVIRILFGDDIPCAPRLIEQFFSRSRVNEINI